MDALNRRVSAFNYASNSTTEYQRFRNEYFTGADIRIYFGDIWLDEITSLQFTLQEQVAPIFGYASYTWDKVARGNRFVQGSFTINFKESYYLQSALSRLSSRMLQKKTAPFDQKTWKEGLDIEHLINSAGGHSFDTVADQFESALWGSKDNAALSKKVSRQPKNTFFYPEHRAVNSETGEIYYDSETSQKQLADHGFNIVISYGPGNENGGASISSTIHTIVGVQLTSVSQVIGGDGQPTQEQYSFIAKDLDGNVTQKA